MQTQREYIRTHCNQGMVLGLDTVRALLGELGSPQDRIPAVQVAGTNGKGSVCAYLSGILQQAGLRVGCFRSPAVFDAYEVISVNGISISEETYEELAGCVAQVMRRWEHLPGRQMPTAFEAETAIAWMYFFRERCDLAIMEAGLGGDLDATNVLKTNLCSVFTSISLDHTRILGDTVEKIAAHKAGILKRGGMAVAVRQSEEALSVLREAAKRLDADFTVTGEPKLLEADPQAGRICFSYGEWKNLVLHARGLYQMENAATALEAATALKGQAASVPERCPETAPAGWRAFAALSAEEWERCVYRGLSAARWSGRMEQLLDEPVFLMDGAHNPDAARRLSETLETCYPLPRIFLFGMFADKDCRQVARWVIRREIAVFTVTPQGERGLAAEKLAQDVREFSDCGQIEAMPDVPAGVRRTLAFAEEYRKQSGVMPVIVAFGSLSWLGQCREAVKEITGRVCG